MYQRIRNYADSVREFGLVPAILNKFQRMRLKRLPPTSLVSLRSKYVKIPLKCRASSSDVHVFGQVFHAREYRCLDSVKTADLIIDCGANVGYSAAYFLSRYPDARLIAVEPDPENFKLLEANVRAYGDRVSCICSGIWSRSAGLVFAPDSLGEGKEWGRMVREVRDGETPNVHAIDIGSILKQSGKERISILKIDIEGSEAAVFSENYHEWIDKVDNIAIELHGKHCEEVFNRAIAGRGFQVSRCDDLTACLRPNHSAIN